MTDVYTSRLRLTKQQTATNRLVWGSVLNEQFIDMLDEAIAGAVEIDVTSGTVTLSLENGATDQARNMTLLITGAPGAARSVIVPSVQKVYTVRNDCGQTVTIRTSGGSGVAITAGNNAVLFVDENLDEVFHPPLHRSQTVAPDTSTMDVIPCAVTGATGGTTTPNFYRHREGDHVSLSCNLIEVTVDSPIFVITGSFFDELDDNRSYPTYILEDTSVRRAFIEILEGSLIITKADLTDWDEPSDRTIPAMTISFRIDD